MKSKKGKQQTSARKGASTEFLKGLLSEVYSPNQIASISFSGKKEFGMDAEVLELMNRIARQIGKIERGIYSFEIFKLFVLYTTTPDIRGLLGFDVQIPPNQELARTKLSKLEKIREEIYDMQNRQRPKTKEHTIHFLTYILEKTAEKHRFLEVVDFKRECCGLESVIEKLCDAAPKDDFKKNPGVHDHIVFVKDIEWPVKGYVISQDIYHNYPELKEFFDTKIGMVFYKSFMNYLATRFPKMQKHILDYVNAFTDRYFQWMISMLKFQDSLEPEIKWKYTPLEAPYRVLYPDCMHRSKFNVRFINCLETGKIRRRFVFLDEVRFILTQIFNLGLLETNDSFAPIQMEGSVSQVHEIAEFTDIEEFTNMLRGIIPQMNNFLEVAVFEMHTLAFIHKMFLPIVSPYNTHCIPAIQGFERIVVILVAEVEIGRRIPLNFRCLESLIKRMEELFAGSQFFKTMVDRTIVHELMQEATELKEKFNGKIKHPTGKLGKIDGKSTKQQIIAAFIDTFNQFAPIVARHEAIPTPTDYKEATSPGEPEIEKIHDFVFYGKTESYEH